MPIEHEAVRKAVTAVPTLYIFSPPLFSEIQILQQKLNAINRMDERSAPVLMNTIIYIFDKPRYLSIRSLELPRFLHIIAILPIR